MFDFSNPRIVLIPARDDRNCSYIGLFVLLSKRFTSLAPAKNREAMNTHIADMITASSSMNGDTNKLAMIIPTS